MLKLFQTIFFVILIQILAIFGFASLTIIFNLDLYNLFTDYTISFIVQNVLIIFIYLLITFLLGLYFKNGYKYTHKARILGILLLTCYLIFFYLDLNNKFFIKYFLIFHYPIGSLFRTMTSSYFTFNVKLSLILSIFSASFGVYLGHKLSGVYAKSKKKKLSSLSKQS